MSRQSNYNKNQFFQKSIMKSQMIQKKKADIKSIKYGNFVEPDPKGVVETGTVEIGDRIEQDLEVVDE